MVGVGGNVLVDFGWEGVVRNNALKLEFKVLALQVDLWLSDL